jgi:hypothetical protein
VLIYGYLEGEIHVRRIVQRHPQTPNMKMEEDMKTEEDDGIVKAILRP